MFHLADTATLLVAAYSNNMNPWDVLYHSYLLDWIKEGYTGALSEIYLALRAIGFTISFITLIILIAGYAVGTKSPKKMEAFKERFANWVFLTFLLSNATWILTIIYEIAVSLI